MIDLLKEPNRSYYRFDGYYPFIVQLGVGGTGSNLVPQIAQAFATTKRKGTYVLVDPDVIETKNLKNQLFLEQEVGLKKADVLASRYSSAYGIPIHSYSEGFVEDVNVLKRCFSKDFLEIGEFVGNQRRSYEILPIVIGCVDNSFTRIVIDELFHQLNHVIYIDSGNEETVMPEDWGTRDKNEWTEEELRKFNESGWTGQVVVGYKNRKIKLPPFCSVFPEVLNEKDDKPSEASCGNLTASFPQRAIVNKFAAMIVANMVTEILEDNTITSKMVDFHAKKNYMNSIPAE